MPNYKNDETSIGRRLGRLLQQYGLRISYATHKANIYSEEEKCASARGLAQKALRAKISANSWGVYAKNLADKRDELKQAIYMSLIGYNDKQKKIWFAYFIDNLSPSEIELQDPNISQRTIQRVVAAMKADMALRFPSKLPTIGDKEAPNWNAKDLASFLGERPSEDYIKGLQDAFDYGVIDIDAIECDEEFQNFISASKVGEKQ